MPWWQDFQFYWVDSRVKLERAYLKLKRFFQFYWVDSESVAMAIKFPETGPQGFQFYWVDSCRPSPPGPAPPVSTFNSIG